MGTEAPHYPIPTLYYEAEGVQLYHGAFQALYGVLPADGVEAIITDPPYAKDSLSLYTDLALLGQIVLHRGGSLLSILPTYALPAVLGEMSRYLKWRWLLDMRQTAGPHARLGMGIEVTWKPIGWWVQGAWPARRGFRPDGFGSPGPDKHLHDWQQHWSWANYCLDFVPPGQRVFDPLCGAGTLLVAARARGYPVIGCDIDAACCAQTRQRLQEAPDA